MLDRNERTQRLHAMLGQVMAATSDAELTEALARVAAECDDFIGEINGGGTGQSTAGEIGGFFDSLVDMLPDGFKADNEQEIKHLPRKPT